MTPLEGVFDLIVPESVLPHEDQQVVFLFQPLLRRTLRGGTPGELWRGWTLRLDGGPERFHLLLDVGRQRAFVDFILETPLTIVEPILNEFLAGFSFGILLSEVFTLCVMFVSQQSR
jgi:hypothetical protein